MLFKCLPPGARDPGRFPGPVHARGKWFTIDIHCHVRSDKADGDGRRQRGGLATGFSKPHANERSRTINRQNGERTRPAGLARPSSASPTWTGWGSTSRRSRPRRARPITAPTPISGIADRARHQRRHRRDLRPLSRPLRRPRHGAVPGPRAGASPSSTDCTNRSGFRGIEIMTHVAGADLSAERFRQIFARCEELGLVVFMHPDGFTEAAAFRRPLLCQCDRQPARLDGGAASPDLRRRAARLPQPQARRRAWRRLSAGLFGPHRPRRGGAPGLLRAAAPDADDLSEAALFRRARLHPPPAATISSISTAPTTS